MSRLVAASAAGMGAMPVTVAAGPADGRVDLPRDVPAAGVMTRRPGVLPRGWRERCAGGVPAPHVGSCRTAACTGRTREPRCRTRSFTRLTRYGDISVCIVRFRERRDHRAVHARPAGLARLREPSTPGWRRPASGRPWPLVPRPSCSPWPPSRSCCWCPATARWPTRSPSDPAGTAGTFAAMPAASPQPRAIAVPSASPAAPDPAASSPAASPTASVTSPSPSATSSPPRCPPGHAKHHRC